MIRTASLLLFTFLVSNSSITNVSTVNSIQFVIDQDCVIEGFELSLED